MIIVSLLYYCMFQRLAPLGGRPQPKLAKHALFSSSSSERTPTAQVGQIGSLSSASTKGPSCLETIRCLSQVTHLGGVNTLAAIVSPAKVWPEGFPLTHEAQAAVAHCLSIITIPYGFNVRAVCQHFPRNCQHFPRNLSTLSTQFVNTFDAICQHFPSNLSTLSTQFVNTFDAICQRRLLQVNSKFWSIMEVRRGVRVEQHSFWVGSTCAFVLELANTLSTMLCLDWVSIQVPVRLYGANNIILKLIMIITSRSFTSRVLSLMSMWNSPTPSVSANSRTGVFSDRLPYKHHGNKRVSWLVIRHHIYVSWYIWPYIEKETLKGGLRC
jgi:hypothetical protein